MNLKGIIKPIFLVAFFWIATAQYMKADVPKGIVLAFNAGNAKELAKYFNSTIELVIDDKEGVYSKLQAEQIVKDFFMKNTPASEGLILLHEGGKEASKYAIGNFYTKNGVYRVSFLIKTVDNVPTIHQLRIEENNV